MNIYIINLEKSKDRKMIIQSQFEKLYSNEISQNINFFPAVYGKENPDFYLFKQYNKEKRLTRKGNEMNLSQLGCFASHYLLWEKCIELNQGIIVLEDDAIIHSSFVEAYQFINSSKNSFEFFWLSPPAPVRRGQKGKVIYQDNETNCIISQYFEAWGNATGYYITPKAAKKFLEYNKEWIYDVDIAMERYWENKVDYLALTPFCLEPDLSLESNIPVDKGRNKRTMVIRIKREWHKLKDKIKKSFYDLIVNHKKWTSKA